MTAITVTPTGRVAPRVGVALGSVAGAALVVAGIWNTLIEEHITVASPPSNVRGVPPLQAMHAYYLWYAGTAAQTRGATILGLVGVTGLLLLVGELRRELPLSVLTRRACDTTQLGAVVWIVGSLAAIGGHRAVALMATHGNPIQTVNAVAFATDVTSDAFSAASFILLAVGMLALAVSSTRGRRWTALNVVTSVLSGVVAFGYLAGIDTITTYELGLLAVVVLPVWLVSTGVSLDRTEAPS
jgi:hypothetical protein